MPPVLTHFTHFTRHHLPPPAAAAAAAGADQGLWGLVNNAGVEVMKLIGDMDDSDTEYQFGTPAIGIVGAR